MLGCWNVRTMFSVGKTARDMENGKGTASAAKDRKAWKEKACGPIPHLGTNEN